MKTRRLVISIHHIHHPLLVLLSPPPHCASISNNSLVVLRPAAPRTVFLSFDVYHLVFSVLFCALFAKNRIHESTSATCCYCSRHVVHGMMGSFHYTCMIIITTEMKRCLPLFPTYDHNMSQKSGMCLEPAIDCFCVIFFEVGERWPNIFAKGLDLKADAGLDDWGLIGDEVVVNHSINIKIK